MSALIIAEVGVNHNGDLELAEQLIIASAETGADVIKFQTALPDLVQTPKAPKAKYQIETTGAEDSALEMSRGFHFPLETFPHLKERVEALGKTFMSTAFDLVSLAFLAELGQKIYKVPSGEITNLPYLRAVAGFADEVIISTGMSTIDEVKAAVLVMLEGGISRDRITVLQCNTAYPTPLDDANILAMVTLGHEVGVRYGYSDHTIGAAAALAAVALGATVIEKHITLDCGLVGPDHSASMEPGDFSQMVQSIREVETALGSPVKSVSLSERENKHMARRGVYFANDMPAGSILSASDLICLRPENEISPMDFDKVVGKQLVGPKQKFDPVSFSELR